MDKIKSNTCFYSEVKDYQIQVPYYQRDYAQGRIDGGRIDNIRQVFVEELFQALINGTICHLGLVFGSYDDNHKVFIAVDGQQRLTTTFLLHWYIAWREGKLSEYRNLLERFSWDTRSYSSQFVDLLFRILPNNSVEKAIKSHCDYFSVWENDPTVKGMITMLKEIEAQYPISQSCLCEKLFSDECNIKYDVLKLEKDSDGKTYLKMNSRGRSLTTFELFKSKFLSKYKPSFDKKIDNEWLSFMLNIIKPSEESFVEPDFAFMNFINEYTYMQLKSNNADNEDSSDNYKEFITAKISNNLTDIPFISFEKYQSAFEDKLHLFESFFDWVKDNYYTIKTIDDEYRFKDSRFFIDAIIKDNNPNYTHRTKLYAAFKYAELSEYKSIDETLYKRWTRVFRNLVANSDIDGKNFSRICKSINRINNVDVYSFFENGGTLTAFDGAQVKEEIAKVKQIIDGNGELRIYEGWYKKDDGSSYATWEKIISEAEKYAFFKGAIRFLFTNAEGKESWEDEFATKWRNSKSYFKENPEPKKSALNETYDNAELLKALISRFVPDNFWTVLNYHYRVFNNYYTTWRYYLLNDNIYAPIHEVMMGNTTIVDLKSSQVEAHNRLYQLSNTKLLDFVINTIPNSWIREYHHHIAIFPSGTGVFLNAQKRDNLLSSTENIIINGNHIIPDTLFLYGSDINFSYNEHFFQWYRNNYVYLMEDNWKDYKKRKNPTADKGNDLDEYFCFKDEPDMTSEDLLNNLDKLIFQFENEKADLQ